MGETSNVAVPIVHLAGVTIDCADPIPMITFYAQAFGAEVSHQDDTGAWIHVDGGPLLLIRRIDDFRAPTWPSQDVPMQLPFEFWIEDLDAAEARLVSLGATRCDFQPHREQGNVVMLDPASHPFCIGTRV